MNAAGETALALAEAAKADEAVAFLKDPDAAKAAAAAAAEAAAAAGGE